VTIPSGERWGNRISLDGDARTAGEVNIEDIFDLIFPEQPNGILAVIFQAFLDDSSDRDQSKVIVSASFIGTREQWTKLRKTWNSRLKEDGLAYFKSSECWHLTGEFAKFRSDSHYPRPAGRVAAEKVRDDLETIVEESGVGGLAVVIPVPVFNEILAMPDVKEKLGDRPYFWVFQSLLFETVKEVRTVPGHHAVTFVHDEGPNSAQLLETYLQFKNSNPRTAKMMCGFSALDDKQHPPLQCADMVANATSHFAIQWLSDRNDATLQRLMHSVLRVAVWDKEYMLEVVRTQSWFTGNEPKHTY
jgi:hypothetical protein